MAQYVDDLPFDIFDLTGLSPFDDNCTLGELTKRLKKVMTCLHPDRQITNPWLAANFKNICYPSINVVTGVFNYFKDSKLKPEEAERIFEEMRQFWARHTGSTMNMRALINGSRDPHEVLKPDPEYQSGPQPWFQPPTSEQVKGSKIVSELLSPLNAEGEKLFPPPSEWTAANNPVYNARPQSSSTRRPGGRPPPPPQRSPRDASNQSRSPNDDGSGTSSSEDMDHPAPDGMKNYNIHTGERSRQRNADEALKRKFAEMSGSTRGDAIIVDDDDNDDVVNIDDSNDEPIRSRKRQAPSGFGSQQSQSQSTANHNRWDRNAWKPRDPKKPRNAQSGDLRIPKRVPEHLATGWYRSDPSSIFHDSFWPNWYRLESDDIPAAKNETDLTPLAGIWVRIGVHLKVINGHAYRCLVYAAFTTKAAFVCRYDLWDEQGNSTPKPAGYKAKIGFSMVELTGHFAGKSEDVVRWIVWHIQKGNWKRAVAAINNFPYRGPHEYC